MNKGDGLPLAAWATAQPRIWNHTVPFLSLDPPQEQKGDYGRGSGFQPSPATKGHPAPGTLLRFVWSWCHSHAAQATIAALSYMCSHYPAVCRCNAPINFPFDILRAIYKSCCLSFVPSLMLGNNAAVLSSSG